MINFTPIVQVIKSIAIHMDALLKIFIGSIVLSIVHAIIPNHWLPIVAIARTEKWTKSESMWVTAITGFAHTASTVIIGIIVGIIGYQLSSAFKIITSTVAPTLLIILGLVYVMLDYNHHRKHTHSHEHINLEEVKKKKNKKAIVLTLSFAMFFSPCLEIEAYYFVASASGWTGIVIVSAVYLLITVIGMMLLVNIALTGIRKIKFDLLENRDKLITGVVLILLGIGSYFIDF